MKRGPKHKLCRRVGACIWGQSKCPSNKRPYPPGSSPRGRRRKLSTFGELLQEKQKLQAHYNLTERQLRFIYGKSQKGGGITRDKFLLALEERLATVVLRSGLAPTIFSAYQAVSHRHVLIDGKVVDRPGYIVKPGQTIAIDPQRSASIASMAQNADITPPPYLEVDRANAKATLTRHPIPDEVPVEAEIMRVIEYYAR